MPTPDHEVARIDLTVRLEFPRPLAGARCIAAWLRRLAVVIERGDSPHSAAVSGTASLRAAVPASAPAPPAGDGSDR